MKTNNTKNAHEYINFFWRRKFTILLPFLVFTLAVTAWALSIPNLYRSSISLFIEPQQVPTDYVRTTITSNLGGRVRTMQQQLSSRTKLLKVMNELNLYEDEIGNGVTRESLVGRMRENLAVAVTNRRDQNFFQVYFIHNDPTKAMLTVSKLVSMFIEESLQVRETEARGTTDFIEEELVVLKKNLEKREASIRDFKKRYMGELPSQLDANLRMLDNLQMQLTDNLEAMRETENRIILLDQEINRLDKEMNLPVVTEDGSGSGSTALSQLLLQRDILQKDISRMESTYTSRHPDLIAARNEMSSLEQRIKTFHDENPADTVSPSVHLTMVELQPEMKREMKDLQRQKSEYQQRINMQNQEEDNLRENIQLYQKRIEMTPKREQELLTLTRDYDNIHASYEQLLDKKLQAQLSENLEKRQKGEKFLILDPANLPGKPYLPNRPRIILVGAMAGFMAGLGLAFLLELLFPVYHELKQVKDDVNVPIIMGIPVIVSRREIRKRRLKWFLGASAGTIILVVGLYLMDQYVMDLVELAEKIKNNLRGLPL